MLYSIYESEKEGVLLNAFLLALMTLENESDRQFMEELYQEYQPLMLRLANKIIREPDTAEDIVEEVLLSFIAKIEILTRQSRPVLRAYIVTSIRNASINHLKRTKNERNRNVYDGETLLENYADDSEDIDAELIFLDTRRELKAALRRLPWEERHVLQMKFFQEMTDGEIAEVLGIRKESVGKKVLRAKNSLRQILIEGGTGDE